MTSLERVRRRKCIKIRCTRYEDVCEEFREFASGFRNYAVALKKLLDTYKSRTRI